MMRRCTHENALHMHGNVECAASEAPGRDSLQLTAKPKRKGDEMTGRVQP